MRLIAFAFAYSCVLSAVPSVLGGRYLMTDNHVGEGFFHGFEHEAIPDPTNGRVNYVDEATALAQNLTFAHGDTFIIRADATTVLSPDGPGRNSVRIRSRRTYEKHVAVFDIRHMPQGCATWPAVWEVREDGWPNYGEVDIVEGVNDVSPNRAALHTSANCTMPAGALMTGTQDQLDCDWLVNYNNGCGAGFTEDNSYGPGFNSAGGGWYAIERTDEGIKIWFWSARNGNPPRDVYRGSPIVDPSDWGTPSAYFPNTQCDFREKFGRHNIIINLTLCGDYAGNTYSNDGCPGSCIDLVNDHPEAFTEAYWEFAAVRVYQ